MLNILSQPRLLRKAQAVATLRVSGLDNFDKLSDGEIFNFARAAAFLGIKRTAELIPECHQSIIESADISISVDDEVLSITVSLQAIHRKGIETEAMHGASLAAITIFEMIVNIGGQVEITGISITPKKLDKLNATHHNLKACIIVCSDSVYSKAATDLSGEAIAERLEEFGISCPKIEVVPDDVNAIRQKTKRLNQSGVKLLILTGGTGLSPRDVTPEAIAPLLDRRIDGIMETARRHGQERTPNAMLSRGIAGFVGEMLVLTFPGSTAGAREYMDALFPAVLHLFEINQGQKH